jgi:predicted peptidase
MGWGRLLGGSVGVLVLFCLAVILPKEQQEVSMSKSESRFSAESADGSSDFGYLLFLPKNHDTTRKWPLLIYLHGAGESGDTNKPEGILQEGATGTIPMLLTSEAPLPELREQFVVVAPRTNRGWPARSVGQFAKALMAQSKLSIDPERAIVTGVSMGGGGTWAAAETGLFAGAVPVCGAGAPRDPSSLKGVGVWAFHGINDIVVPVSYSDQNVEALKAAGVENVKYNRIENSPAPVGWPDYDGHASWIPAYQTPGLFDWMLQQRGGSS